MEYLSSFVSDEQTTKWAVALLVAAAVFILCVALSIFFAGAFSRGVQISSDNGGTWLPINNGLTNLNVVTIGINSDGVLFAGTAGGGVFRSVDNGQNWNEVNNGTYLMELLRRSLECQLLRH